MCDSMGQRHLPPRQLHPRLPTNSIRKITQTTDNTYAIHPLRVTMRPVTALPWPSVPIPSPQNEHTRAHPSPCPLSIPGMFAWLTPCRLLTHISPRSPSCVSKWIITLLLTYSQNTLTHNDSCWIWPLQSHDPAHPSPAFNLITPIHGYP